MSCSKKKRYFFVLFDMAVSCLCCILVEYTILNATEISDENLNTLSVFVLNVSNL